MGFYFVLYIKGLIFLLFIPGKAGVTQQHQLSSLRAAQGEEEETQSAASPNQPAELARQGFLRATKNAQNPKLQFCV